VDLTLMNLVNSTNLAGVLITKKIIMKNLFYQGGPLFMGILTILLIITVAWFIYQFVISYHSKKINQEKLLRLFSYGKSMGLFALSIGILGQMVGLTAMFLAIEDALQRGEEVIPALVFGGIKVTMITTIYGMLIFIFSLMLWFAASILIEKKFK
jgi:hypothetical protein